MHVKGYAAPETKAAVERARLLIEQAEAPGEPPEDPLLLFSVLYGFWARNFVAFNGDVCRDLAAQFLALAEKQGATAPLMIGHRLMGTLCFIRGTSHKGAPLRSGSRALRSCEHRPLATRFGQDAGVAILVIDPGLCGCLAIPMQRLRMPTSAQGCARDRSSRNFDVCAGPRIVYLYSLRKLRSNCAIAEKLFTLADEKGA